MGFFGYTAADDDAASQPRHRAVIDLDDAFLRSEDVLDAWVDARRWPDAPPFSGGVLDAWPARLAQGLAVCRYEEAAVRACLRAEAKTRRR